MSTYYLKSGNTFRVTSKEAMDLHEKLPPNNYTICQDQAGNLYLEVISEFEFKGKRYGDLNRNQERIFNTFIKRPSATGVMLAGEKGSGKSLLARAVCMHAAVQGVPTIVINAPWHGDKFNTFLQTIEQPAVVLFDEFEKVYPAEDQEKILTLLDGVFPSKKLFILTCNDKWRVNSNMRNRPGRIFYMLDFKGLDCNFITEYCNDNLNDKSHIAKICAISALFTEFNFDMLKALVEDMNRYNESPESALQMLNVKPEFDQNTTRHHVEFLFKGVPVDKGLFEPAEWKGNPLMGKVEIGYRAYKPGKTPIPGAPVSNDDDDDWDWDQTNFSPHDIRKIEAQSGKFVYVNKDGHTVILSRVSERPYRWEDAL